MTELRPQEEETIISSSSKSSGNLIGEGIQKRDTREVDNTEIVSQFLTESSSCFKSVNFHSLILVKSEDNCKPVPYEH